MDDYNQRIAQFAKLPGLSGFFGRAEYESLLEKVVEGAVEKVCRGEEPVVSVYVHPRGQRLLRPDYELVKDAAKCIPLDFDFLLNRGYFEVVERQVPSINMGLLSVKLTPLAVCELENHQRNPWESLKRVAELHGVDLRPHLPGALTGKTNKKPYVN